MIASLLRLAAASAAGQVLKDAATQATGRLLLGLAALAAAVAGVLCFSLAALTLLERHMDPVGAWAVIGGFYSAAGGALYFAATRSRRT